MDRTHATNLMRLHLRLAVIKNEIELLENPEMRIMYEEIHFSTKSNNGNEHGETTNYIVSRDGTISQHISYLEAAKAFIPEDKSIKIIPILQVWIDFALSITYFTQLLKFIIKNIFFIDIFEGLFKDQRTIGSNLYSNWPA